MVGVLYDSGQGVAKDESKAAQWFAAAAAQGHADAQYNLGMCDRARDSFACSLCLLTLIADCKWKVYAVLKAGE
jgi:TPR repeat protein